MAKYSKFNIIYILQKWMESVAGQTFMNYAYSWGASIVILGTLFKLTHLPGANIMLFIGMGTEVFVFFIAAFDRPFDKTSDGKALASDAELAKQLGLVEELAETEAHLASQNANIAAHDAAPVVVGGNVGGTIVIGAPSAEPQTLTMPTTEAQVISSSEASTEPMPSVENNMPSANGPVVIGGGSGIVGAPAPAVSPETAEAMEEATTTYVDRLNELNELLLKVGAQSERLTTDSEEMENLNRTLTGIARVYEMQLKSASQQMSTQDEINDQTRQLAKQIAELNAIYARMIEAMTVNMPGAVVKN